MFRRLIRPLSARTTTVIRISCGLLLSPFMVMVPFAVAEAGMAGVVSGLIATAVMFPLTFALGLPIDLALRWKGWLKWYHFALAGTLAGLVPMLVAIAATNADLYAGRVPYGDPGAMLRVHGQAALGSAALGSMAALSFWLLVHSRLQLMPPPKTSKA